MSIYEVLMSIFKGAHGKALRIPKMLKVLKAGTYGACAKRHAYIRAFPHYPVNRRNLRLSAVNGPSRLFWLFSADF
jgi:hypothetical protein